MIRLFPLRRTSASTVTLRNGPVSASANFCGRRGMPGGGSADTSSLRIPSSTDQSDRCWTIHRRPNASIVSAAGREHAKRRRSVTDFMRRQLLPVRRNFGESKNLVLCPPETPNTSQADQSRAKEQERNRFGYRGDTGIQADVIPVTLT